MNRIKGFGYLVKLDILRTFRDLRFVVLVIMLPVIFYVLYMQLFDPKSKLNGTTWATYAIVSMAAFGIMGTAINFMGTRLQKERDEKWYDFLKITAIPETYYSISKTISYIVLSFVSVFLMLLIGFLTQGVRLDFLQVMILFGYLVVGSAVFVSLALLISLMGTGAQPLGTLLYLLLSFIGGLWIPVEAMPTLLQHIAKLMPTYHYAKIMWNMVGHEPFSLTSLLFLIGWFLVFSIVYGLLTRRKRLKA